MKKFHLLRLEDESGVSGTGVVAEGCLFSNGYAVLNWLTDHTSLGIYPGGVEELIEIHGHHGKTKVVFDDAPQQA